MNDLQLCDRARLSRLLAGSLLLVAVCAANTFGQAPAISHTTPAAVLPGQASDIVLHGGNLAGPTGVWLSVPGEVALTPNLDKNGADPAKISYRVTVPATVPVGIYALRLATGGGISNARLWMVDDLPSLAENGANKSRDAAQEIPVPCAVDGACEPESYDYYKLHGIAGQRVTVEVVARRLGYPLDPVVRLLDANGRELAYSDDAPGVGADCRFAFQFPADGDYLLEVRDIRYQGGGTHRYRLRVGNFPLVTTAYPLGARRGTSARLQWAGYTTEELPSLQIAIPAKGLDRIALAAKFATGQGSSMGAIVADSLTEQIEFEPNDSPETASPISLPTALNGRFDAAKDRDYYQFEAKQGQRWIFTGATRALGSPADLYLRLLKADGGQVAEAEDSGTDEGVLDFTAPADGVYRLLVEDLLRRGGADFVYRIGVEAYRPGFTLALDNEKFDAPQGGVFVTKVTCARRDYDGPITLAVEGAEGLTLAGNVIPEKGKETVLSVTLPATLPQGRWANIRVVGRAKIGDADFQTTASILPPLKAAFSGWSYPPADLDGLVGLGVGPVFADFFQLSTAPASAIPFPQIVGSTTFKVAVNRLNNFAEKVDLAVEGLPPGVTAKAPAIEKGKPDAAIELAGPAALAEGDYPFRIVGRGNFQNQPKTVLVENLVLRVVKPLQVALVAAGPLNVGGKQTVTAKLTRFGDINGPVTLRLRNLPAGVSGPAEVTIAEGQGEAAFELAAAADAPAGKLELVVGSMLAVKDRTLALESDPISVDIIKP